MNILRKLVRNPYVLLYMAIYFAFLGVCHFAGGMSAAEPLLILLVLGVGFTTLAWATTRRVTPISVAVHRPAAETGLLLACLFVLAAFLTWGMDALERINAAPRAHAGAVLGAKLALFVILPGMLMAKLHGYRLSELAKYSREWPHTRAALQMAAVVVLFQAVFGRGLRDLQSSGVGVGWLLLATPVVFLSLLVEVGLIEEFFFRALLQSRLAALLKSEVAGVVLASLLFGLAHAPGLYFRTGRTLEALGPHPSWHMAVGYSVVVTSVAGFFLGLLWARTKNLAVLMFVHAAGDLLPNILPTLKAWELLSSR